MIRRYSEEKEASLMKEIMENNTMIIKLQKQIVELKEVMEEKKRQESREIMKQREKEEEECRKRNEKEREVEESR